MPASKHINRDDIRIGQGLPQVTGLDKDISMFKSKRPKCMIIYIVITCPHFCALGIGASVLRSPPSVESAMVLLLDLQMLQEPEKTETTASMLLCLSSKDLQCGFKAAGRGPLYSFHL